MSKSKEIADHLEQIVNMLEFKGDNPFKINAFKNGANAVRRMGDELDKVIEENRLNGIKGIGKGLQSVIYEFYEKGNSALYNELKNEFPSGIEEIFKVRGLGPKKIKILYDELGISSIGELEYACKENRLALLKGFGKATQVKILSELEKLKYYDNFILLNTAEKYVSQIKKLLSDFRSIDKLEISGQFRRGMEIISAIQIVIQISDEEQFFNQFEEQFSYEKEGHRLVLKENYPIPIFLHITENITDFTKELFLTTGSDEFLEELKVSFAELSGRSEEEIFNKMRAPYVIPEMREKEYFSIKDKKLRSNSRLSLNNFKGLLHFHTVSSDGRNTLAEMINKGKELGFEFAAVCDHSKSAFYANGLSEERILKQTKEIRQLTSEKGFRIFQGIESDILHDGRLDYDDDFLNNFDFVVASVHSRFSMNEEEMTSRMIKAIENPVTDLLGHPSGRLLLSREPYKFNVKKVIDACSRNQVAIEINANPHRLDLDWRMIYYAREKGCLFSVNPDAHSVGDISLIEYGIKIARKGGLQPEEVINCFKIEDFINYLKRKVKRNIK